ncbi:hypothetical protein V6N13_035936 [Hibiscus sabdariffa]
MLAKPTNLSPTRFNKHVYLVTENGQQPKDKGPDLPFWLKIKLQPFQTLLVGLFVSKENFTAFSLFCFCSNACFLACFLLELTEYTKVEE